MLGTLSRKSFKRGLKRLLARITLASKGSFKNFGCLTEEAVELYNQHKDIPCVDSSGLPYIFTSNGKWIVSPKYIEDASSTYEPVLYMACIEAAANGLEMVRIYKKTGATSVPNYSGTVKILPENAEKAFIKKIVTDKGDGDIVFEEDDASYVIRWDDYLD